MEEVAVIVRLPTKVSASPILNANGWLIPVHDVVWFAMVDTVGGVFCALASKPASSTMKKLAIPVKNQVFKLVANTDLFIIDRLNSDVEE